MFFLFVALSVMQKPGRVTMRTEENLSSLRDFQTAAESMARKRHFAAGTRGAFLFLFFKLIKISPVTAALRYFKGCSIN